MNLSSEFPILRELVFFNHAGVAPITGRAAAAIRQYADQASHHAYHKAGWYAYAKRVKQSAATLIHARGPHEIAFVPNTSTGLSIVAKAFKWQHGDQVVITNVEYPANRYPWEDLKRFGVDVIEVPQQADGRIDPEDVAEAVTNHTRIVSVSHVQYASGHRIDLKPISDMVHAAGGYLCVDAIQSVGALPVDVQAMGVDFLSADGHKWMLSPEGCGILYCREDLIELMHPNVVGWMNMVNASDYGNYQFTFEKDARRFEPGSYNIPGIIGMGASLELLLEVGIDHVWSRIDALTTQLCNGLERLGFKVFSPRRDPQERSGIVIFDPPSGLSPAHIVAELEKQGIIIVVREGRLRASPHFYNSEEQVEKVLAGLEQTVNQ